MRTRLLPLAVLSATLTVLVLVVAHSARSSPDSRSESSAHFRVVGFGQVSFDGLGPEAWSRQAHYWRRAYLRERRELLSSRTVTEAIDLACATYGFCATLWRKARCETGGTFSPTAHNPSGASGLFQFLPSTWATTPYRSLSIWSPYANALAAGWMHANGRSGEWSCR